MGGWHPLASKAIGRRLGGTLAAHTGKERSVVTAHVFQRLSVALQKGNGSLILSGIPEHPSPEVDGDINFADQDNRDLA